MADSTLPPAGVNRNLLLGVLALQLDFVCKADLQAALQDWARDPARSLAGVLVDRAALAPRRRLLLEELVAEFLVQHDGDVERGLASACAARATPLDVEAISGPALRGSLATLPSSPRTLAGTLPGSSRSFPPAAAAVGSPTSSGLRFRILRPHARGALGVVYLARDEELHREVALKEIQDPYHRSPDSRARFLLEAEITGGLEHPGIVPVYGLGVYADGRPYYAMRFIKGDSLYDAITRFHQADAPGRAHGERALALRGLLRRFVDVCNAIAYAHSKGVIHRDIKPSNVMLGPYGETLVVDWGLAKVFDEPCTVDSKEIPISPKSASAQATMLGQAVGTPAYMPPEQAQGRVDEVGPASDIYSLGATLYHLLTGVPAFPGYDANAVIRQVVARDFPPPRQVKRQVPAALEAVVLKAMAEKPEGRYPSVAALANEVERWLADEPVEAYPEPVWQRAQRWGKRNRTLVSAGVALLLTAAVGLGAGLYFVGKERDQAQRNLVLAEENLNLAKKAVDQCFVVATEDPMLQKDRMRGVRKLLLEKSLPFYQGFRTQKPDDDAIQEELGHNFFRVGRITSEIGRQADAIRSYEQARDIFSRQVDRHPENAEYRADLARVYNNLGLLLGDTGKRQAALESHQQARRLREDLAKSGKSADRADLAETLNNLGSLLAQRGRADADQAKEMYRRAADIQAKLADEYRDERRYRIQLAATQHNLGQLLAERRDYKGAAEAYEKARTMRERLARGESETGQYRAALADTLTNEGDLLREMGKPDEARKTLDEACKLYGTLAEEFRDTAEYRSGLAAAQFILGHLLAGTGQPDQALETFRRADDIQRQLVEDNPEVVRYKKEQAATRTEMAKLLREAGKPEEAMRLFGRLFELVGDIEKRDDSPEATRLARNAHAERARSLDRLKRHRDAIADWNAAVNRAEVVDRADLRTERAISLAHAGDRAEAIREVEDLEKDASADAERLYNLACAAALCAAGEASGSERLGGKAVGLLERAWKGGLFKDAEKLKYMKEDGDLKAVRERPDYKALLARVEKAPGGA